VLMVWAGGHFPCHENVRKCSSYYYFTCKPSSIVYAQAPADPVTAIPTVRSVWTVLLSEMGDSVVAKVLLYALAHLGLVSMRSVVHLLIF
jgi:hypothetical protein